jgi:hypothetical protein
VLLLAASGLVVGLAAPAAGREAHHLISGSTIKKHSIAGDRLKRNTVKGREIKESTLGTVPRAKTATTATKLPPLVWHTITTFSNGWKSGGPDRPVAYAIDAQGMVHLRGVLQEGTVGEQAFELPAAASPPTGDSIYVMPIASGGEPGDLLVSDDGSVVPLPGIAGDTAVSGYTGLDGVSFFGR